MLANKLLQSGRGMQNYTVVAKSQSPLTLNKNLYFYNLDMRHFMLQS